MSLCGPNVAAMLSVSGVRVQAKNVECIRDMLGLLLLNEARNGLLSFKDSLSGLMVNQTTHLKRKTKWKGNGFNIPCHPSSVAEQASSRGTRWNEVVSIIQLLPNTSFPSTTSLQANSSMDCMDVKCGGFFLYSKGNMSEYFGPKQ